MTEFKTCYVCGLNLVYCKCDKQKYMKAIHRSNQYEFRAKNESNDLRTQLQTEKERADRAESENDTIKNQIEDLKREADYYKKEAKRMLSHISLLNQAYGNNTSKQGCGDD